MKMQTIKPSVSPFRQTIIAEIGSVHDGSFGNACKLIEAAASCGADVVKFQTHIAEAESLANAPMPAYFQGEPRMEYLRRTAFTQLQWVELISHCQEVGVDFMSSVFSIEAVDLLETLRVVSYKIPSGEVTNLPLLTRVAQTEKPILLSSGMNNWAELDCAVEVLSNSCPLTILQCTSAYPCPPEQVGLNVITEMMERWKLPVGFSDHSNGYAAASAAVAMGASVVEKHFTFSRLMYGSDAANAMEPPEFKSYCSGLRDIWTMQSNPVNKDDLEPYRVMKIIFEKSVVTARPLSAGHCLTRKDLAFKKPGDGFSAARWRELLGRRLAKNLPSDHKFDDSDLIGNAE